MSITPQQRAEMAAARKQIEQLRDKVPHMTPAERADFQRLCATHKDLSQREGAPTPTRAIKDELSATQALIRAINAKGDRKTLRDVKTEKTLHAKTARLNAEERVRDDAEVKRAVEKVRARRAQRADTIDVMHATRAELRDASLEVLERDGGHLSPHQQDAVDSLVRNVTDDVNPVEIGRRLLTTQSPAYISAFRKEMQPGLTVWTEEEKAAITAYRAASEGTNAAGGFGVPVLVDPTILPSAGASAAPVLDLATTIVVTTNAWRGVTAAAPSWAWKGEGAAVGESDPTLAQPTIQTYEAAGYVEASYEVAADYPDFAAEMLSILAVGYVDMVANATITGSGSSQPYGVFVQMVNTTTSPSHIVCSTAGALGAVDVRKAFQSLPQRWRGNATWLASPAVETLVKGFGGTTGSSLVDYVATLTESGTRISALEGRPLVTSDYCSSFSGSTSGAAGITGVAMVVGDFRNGVRVISRAGLNMEVVQHVPSLPTSNTPAMQQGYLCSARVGWSVIVPDALRVISNA